MGSLIGQADGSFSVYELDLSDSDDEIMSLVEKNLFDIPVASLMKPSVKKPLRDHFRISNPKAVLIVNVASN